MPISRVSAGCPGAIIEIVPKHFNWELNYTSNSSSLSQDIAQTHKRPAISRKRGSKDTGFKLMDQMDTSHIYRQACKSLLSKWQCLYVVWKVRGQTAVYGLVRFQNSCEVPIFACRVPNDQCMYIYVCKICTFALLSCSA